MLSVIELPAADAQYHEACSVNFRKKKHIPLKYTPVGSSRGLPTSICHSANTGSSDSFEKTCEWFQKNYEEQLSVSDTEEKCGFFFIREKSVF